MALESKEIGEKRGLKERIGDLIQDHPLVRQAIALTAHAAAATVMLFDLDHQKQLSQPRSTPPATFTASRPTFSEVNAEKMPIQEQVQGELKKLTAEALEKYVYSQAAQESKVEAIPSADLYYRIGATVDVLKEVQSLYPLPPEYDWKKRQSEFHERLGAEHEAGLERVFAAFPQEEWTGNPTKDLIRFMPIFFTQPNSFFKEGPPPVGVNDDLLTKQATLPSTEFNGVGTCQVSRYVLPLLKEIYTRLGLPTQVLENARHINWLDHGAFFWQNAEGGIQYHHFNVFWKGTHAPYSEAQGAVQPYSSAIMAWLDTQDLLPEEAKSELVRQNFGLSKFSKADLPDFIFRNGDDESGPITPQAPNPKPEEDEDDEDEIYRKQLKTQSKEDLKSTRRFYLENIRWLISLDREKSCHSGEAFASLCPTPYWIVDPELRSIALSYFKENFKFYNDPNDTEQNIFYIHGFASLALFSPDDARDVLRALAQIDPPQTGRPIEVKEVESFRLAEEILAPLGYEVRKIEKPLTDAETRAATLLQNFIQDYDTTKASGGDVAAVLKKASSIWPAYEYVLTKYPEDEGLVKQRMYSTIFSGSQSAEEHYGEAQFQNHPRTAKIIREIEEKEYKTDGSMQSNTERLYLGFSVPKGAELTPLHAPVTQSQIAFFPPSMEYVLYIRSYYQNEPSAEKRQQLLNNLASDLGSGFFYEVFSSRADLNVVDVAWIYSLSNFEAKNNASTVPSNLLPYFYTNHVEEYPQQVVWALGQSPGCFNYDNLDLDPQYPEMFGTPIQEAEALRHKTGLLAEKMFRRLRVVNAELAEPK